MSFIGYGEIDRFVNDCRKDKKIASFCDGARTAQNICDDFGMDCTIRDFVCMKRQSPIFVFGYATTIHKYLSECSCYCLETKSLSQPLKFLTGKQNAVNRFDLIQSAGLSKKETIEILKLYPFTDEFYYISIIDKSFTKEYTDAVSELSASV